VSTPGILRAPLTLLLVLIAGFFLTLSTDVTTGDRVPLFGGTVGPIEPPPELALTRYVQSIAPLGHKGNCVPWRER